MRRCWRGNPDLFESEWFPPSLCSTGAEAIAALGLAATATSAGATILGTQNQAQAATRQADSQARALELKAAADRVQANQEAAYQQRQALTERRKTDLALSRAQAVAASQGGLATDPSTLNVEEGIAQQGQYNVLSAIAAGKTREASLNYQSDIDLFNAGRYREAGPVAARGAVYSGLGSLAGLAGTTADRYYRYKLPLGGGTT